MEKKNSILRILDESGSHINLASIKSVIINHFKRRFCQNHPFTGFSLDLNLPSLSLEVTACLEMPFTLEEIKVAVWHATLQRLPVRLEKISSFISVLGHSLRMICCNYSMFSMPHLPCHQLYMPLSLLWFPKWLGLSKHRTSDLLAYCMVFITLWLKS